MDAKQEQILRDAYEEWRKNPITGILIKNLQRHKDTFIRQSSAMSIDSKVPDNTFRLFMYGVKTTDSILEMITKFETFNKQD